MAVLEDVWPDGSSHRVSSGFLRASLRGNPATYKPKPQGQLLYKIEMASLANVFQRGHRIRLTLHQVNTTDANSASRTTRLSIGAQRARLTLHVSGGALKLRPPGPCTDCKPAALAQETLDPLFKRYITAGAKGAGVGIALHARLDAKGQAGGSVIATFPDGSASGAGVLKVEVSSATGYHYKLSLTGGHELHLRCEREQDRGAFSLQVGTTTYASKATTGAIHCYDVPYVNW